MKKKLVEQLGLFAIEEKPSLPPPSEAPAKAAPARTAKETEELDQAIKESLEDLKLEAHAEPPYPAQAAHSDVQVGKSAETSSAAHETSTVRRLSGPEIWNQLVSKADEWKLYMEQCHAQEYDSKWAKEYNESLAYLQALYVLLAPLDRENIEGFRLKVRKEIVQVEHKMQELFDRQAVTRGNKLDEEALIISLRHLRLLDQYEALSFALAQQGARKSA